MDSPQSSDAMSIGQLGHHVGLHVSVNLEGKTVGGVFFEAEQWLPGVVVGMSALGAAVTIRLDQPVGAGQREGLLHRESRGEDMVSIDDPARVRPIDSAHLGSGDVPEEIVELVRAGKTKKAIKRYRALNGATLDEAQAAIARVR
jgi:hypothetical protein